MVWGWLFRKRLTRERAVAIATDFLAAHGYKVVQTADDAAQAGDDIPVVFRSASLPGRRWYVGFERVLTPGHWRSHTLVEVIVWDDTGQPTFDYADRD